MLSKKVNNMTQSERRIFLIQYLLNEVENGNEIKIPSNTFDQKSLLRGLMNIRLARKVDDEFLKIQNEYLQEETREKGIVDVDDLVPIQKGIYVWQGDITRLKCDAIVNAANSGMTGCYVPNHRYIDNCIHTFAGVQLRLNCADLMAKQGHSERTGNAKITSAFNLPCKYVIHTVGPIVSGRLTRKDCELLKSCYNSCLEKAVEMNLKGIAFCCISTGEFHFPNEKASEIAVETVKNFMKKDTSLEKVIFNVFKDKDKEIYENLLG